MKQPGLTKQDYAEWNEHLETGLSITEKLECNIKLNGANSHLGPIKNLMLDFSESGRLTPRAALIADILKLRTRLVVGFDIKGNHLHGYVGDLISVQILLDKTSENLTQDETCVRFTANYITAGSLRSEDLNTPDFVLPNDELLDFPESLLSISNPHPKGSNEHLRASIQSKTIQLTKRLLHNSAVKIESHAVSEVVRLLLDL